MRRLSWLVVLAGCGGVEQSPCGAGTVRQGDTCVLDRGPQAACGVGTALVSGQCVADLSAVCGTDTAGAAGDHCVGTVTCGTGTVRVGQQCVSTGSGVTCGAGTQLQGHECVVASSSGPLATFLDAPALHVAGHLAGDSHKRLVVTDLSQGNAEAWAASEAGMIGAGRGLHISGKSYSQPTTGSPVFLTIADSCSAVYGPADAPGYDGDAFVGFFSWSMGSPSRVTCARQGSVKLELLYSGGAYQTRVTLNAIFSDGSTVTDKVFSF